MTSVFILTSTSQHLLDGIDGSLAEQWLTTLLAHPRREIIDDQMVSLPGGGVAHSSTHQGASTVQAFHNTLFFRVRQSCSHCSWLGK